MGCAGAKRLHGGRFAGPRHSRERHLSGERGHGIFGPRGEGRSEGAEAGGRSARGGGGGDAERGEFSERDTRAAAAEILRYFFLTIIVITTSLSLRPRRYSGGRRCP